MNPNRNPNPDRKFDSRIVTTKNRCNPITLAVTTKHVNLTLTRAHDRFYSTLNFGTFDNHFANEKEIGLIEQAP